jgi:hypothetical protein
MFLISSIYNFIYIHILPLMNNPLLMRPINSARLMTVDHLSLETLILYSTSLTSCAIPSANDLSFMHMVTLF